MKYADYIRLPLLVSVPDRSEGTSTAVARLKRLQSLLLGHICLSIVVRIHTIATASSESKFEPFEESALELKRSPDARSVAAEPRPRAGEAPQSRPTRSSPTSPPPPRCPRTASRCRLVPQPFFFRSHLPSRMAPVRNPDCPPYEPFLPVGEGGFRWDIGVRTGPATHAHGRPEKPCLTHWFLESFRSFILYLKGVLGSS